MLVYSHTAHQKILDSYIHNVYLLTQSQNGTVEMPLDLLFEDMGQSPGLLLPVFVPSDSHLTSFSLSSLTCKLRKTRPPLPFIEMLGRPSKGKSL